MDSTLLEQVEAYLGKHYWDIEAMSKSGISFSVDLRYHPPGSDKLPTWSQKLKKKFDFLFSHLEDSFADKLWKLIKEKNKTEVEVYKKAHLDRRLFSKIRSDKNYNPSRNTAIALAISLELDENETVDLLSRAGYAFSVGNKSDIIILYFIEHKQYDIFVINEVLEHYGLPTLGG